MERRADTVSGGRWVREDVPLPDAHDDPSSFSQISINAAIASLVGRELGDPPIAPIRAKRCAQCIRPAVHQAPSMPEVAIHKDRHPAA